MKRQFVLSALFLLVTIFSFGQGYQVQSKYFVYLQTEPAQPFYIKINNQKIDANASGYLILPQLKDGDYKLIVGFPQGKAEEQAFNFKIDSKDKGYLIKDYGADGWGLFDLQTMAVQKAIKGGAKEDVAIKQPPVQQPEPKKEETAASNVSDFTKVLSQAAKDPSLLEKPKPEPVEEKPVVVAQQPAVVVNQPQQQTSQPEPKVIQANPSSGTNASMVKLVYDERNESGQVDPITIFIPAPSTVKASQPPVAEKKNEPVEEAVVTKEESVSGEKGFNVLEKKPLPPKEDVKKEEKVAVKATNAACKSVADEGDFLKLRRTMASEANDDSMIAQAQKAFTSKCYTTAQVKYLSSMFLSNAGKYNFYAAAYPHIADKENFSSLASEIKDQAYKDRFNKLLQ